MNNEWGLSVSYWINIWMKGLLLRHEICDWKLWDTKSIEGFYPILIEFILLRDWTLKNVLHPFIWENFRNFHSIMNIWKARVFQLVECVIYNQQSNFADSQLYFILLLIHVLSQSLLPRRGWQILFSTLCIDDKYFIRILKISINT